MGKKGKTEFLEVNMQYSIVNYKNVLEANSDLRIDGEYFKPDFLSAEKRIEKIHFALLENIADVKGGKRLPLGETFADDGIPYIRAEDIRMFADYTSAPKIALELHKKLRNYQTKYNDVLLTIVGNSIGDAGIVKFTLDKCNLTENCAKLVNLKNILAEYLFTFLLSRYGQNQIHREKVGTAQPKLALVRIRKFKIPILTNEFQNTIAKIINTANVKINGSNQTYYQAEQILLSELNLLNWKPKHRLSFIKNFSDTQASDRIDAEYFQPMYEEIVKAVKALKNHACLGDIVKIKDKNFMPKEDVTYKYIELANISANGNINGFIEAIGKELPARARRKVNVGDVIVSSIEGSLSSIALIADDLENALCSTGFFVVNSDKINSETLLVLLKSPIGQLQLKKGCSGTILTAIGNDEFNRIILPQVSASIQEEIRRKITEMYNAKTLSRHLLEIAKRGVEIAIEKSEKAAQGWIGAELKKLKNSGVGIII